jgi:peptide/nickel transport system substrate-binding protein
VAGREHLALLHPEYDALHAELTQTADIDERAEIARELNDMMTRNGAMIPLVHRGRLSAMPTRWAALS